jgi:hypothetical protein
MSIRVLSRITLTNWRNSHPDPVGLTRYRRELAAQLWREWSPARSILDADFERTAPSFDNPDFVGVVIHSYRHRFGLAPGAEAYAEDERVLARLPTVDVPAIVLDPPRIPRCTHAHESSTPPGFPVSWTTGGSRAGTTRLSMRPPKSRSPCAICARSWSRRRSQRARAAFMSRLAGDPIT